MIAPPRVLATLASALAISAAAAPAAGAATPGSAGLGDRLFPTLGNGGYDARHYVLDLRYATASVDEAVTGVVRMNARATQDLSSFDLDFAGRSIESVAVNGRPTTFSLQGQELVVTPSSALRRGSQFEVRVAFTSNPPTQADLADEESLAFIKTPDGTALVPQPNHAHYFYPSNDHPRDKATFAFRLDVPAGVTAVANGIRTGKTTRDGRTVWRYLMRQPMATELTQIAVGDFCVVSRGRQGGLRDSDVQIRDVVPCRLASELLPITGTEKDHLNWMVRQLGEGREIVDYPFDAYGSLVVDVPLGVALETQSLSIFDTFLLQVPRSTWEPIMVHELAHQWFGDSVAPFEWSDVWLNEGHATWYEYQFAEERGQIQDYFGVPTFEDFMHVVYGVGDQFRRDFGPVAMPAGNALFEVFNPNVYFGGALTLYALQQRVGARDFRAIEREWVRRNEGRSRSTEDFIRLASQVSHEDLSGFLHDWLYGTTTPPMPGHPDWTQAPPQDAAAAAGTAAALQRSAAFREVLAKR